MAEVQENSKNRTSIKALCNQFSTRFLIEISLDPTKYELEFSDSEYDFSKSFEKHSHDIYVIDTSGSDRENNNEVFKSVIGLKIKGLRQVILITPEPRTGMNRMHHFGPLCLVEANFSRARFNDTLRQVMSIKDTGVRVKSDSDFFDISIFKT